MIDATFQAWRPQLVRFCANLLRHVHDAEEVVQDVFTKLLERPEYDLSVDPEVLLFRLARNRCIDLRRKRAATLREDLEAQARDEGPGRDLVEALATLSFEEREVLLLVEGAESCAIVERHHRAVSRELRSSPSCKAV